MRPQVGKTRAVLMRAGRDAALLKLLAARSLLMARDDEAGADAFGAVIGAWFSPRCNPRVVAWQLGEALHRLPDHELRALAGQADAAAVIDPKDLPLRVRVAGVLLAKCGVEFAGKVCREAAAKLARDFAASLEHEDEIEAEHEGLMLMD